MATRPVVPAEPVLASLRLPPSGWLVVLEGIDGSGKSSLSRALASALTERGLPVVQTGEPTGGPFGQLIRAQAQSQRLPALAEFSLFHCDRFMHVAERVRPALQKGMLVLQDRSYFSSMAYQGQRGVDRALIRTMSEAVAPRPDRLFVVDVPVALALERIQARQGSGADAFEKHDALLEIRDFFKQLPGAVILDGTRPLEKVLADALSYLQADLTPSS